MALPLDKSQMSLPMLALADELQAEIRTETPDLDRVASLADALMRSAEQHLGTDRVNLIRNFYAAKPLD